MLTGQVYEALFRDASIGIVIVDAQGKIILANDFLLNLFGYTREDLIGLEIEVLIPPRYKTSHKYNRNNFLLQPHPRPMGGGFELFAITKKGNEFPAEVSLTCITYNDQKYAVAYISDISFQKNAEQSLIATNYDLEKKVNERTQAMTSIVEKLNIQLKNYSVIDEELKKANSYLKSIWNHAGAIMIATNKSGIVELFNPAAERYLGYSASEIIGKQSFLLFHDPKEIDIYAQKLSIELNKPIQSPFEVLAEQAKNNAKLEQEWTYVTKNGSRIPVDLTITNLQSCNHCFEGFLEIAIDVSDRKKAEAELLSALQKEKELNELKSRFVSIASHEFRTPLSTILSSVYLISQYKSEQDQPRRTKHIERIVSAVGTLNEILTDLLSVGKIEEGKMQVNFIEFNIVKHIEGVIADLQGLIKSNQKLTHKHAGKEYIYSDPALLKHIITNLVSNAIKFSPEGNSIRIITRRYKKSFVLVVKDHGIGIPDKDHQHLFELFYRGSNANNIQGTGLGLHIVKSYVELLNGEARIKSKEGKGTEFTVLINQ